MVLRVCGATLQDLTDIEDAFQATFLILARRARSIREPGSVGSWLFGVARRTAAHSRIVRDPSPPTRTSTGAHGDRIRWPRKIETISESALWDEVGRLPEKYRAPIVLCYLEGLTHDGGRSSVGMAGRYRRGTTGAGTRTAPNTADPTRPGAGHRAARWRPVRASGAGRPFRLHSRSSTAKVAMVICRWKNRRD